jgi:hypothetical protein
VNPRIDATRRLWLDYLTTHGYPLSDAIDEAERRIRLGISNHPPRSPLESKPHPYYQEEK